MSTTRRSFLSNLSSAAALAVVGPAAAGRAVAGLQEDVLSGEDVARLRAAIVTAGGARRVCEWAYDEAIGHGLQDLMYFLPGLLFFTEVLESRYRSIESGNASVRVCALMERPLPARERTMSGDRHPADRTGRLLLTALTALIEVVKNIDFTHGSDCSCDLCDQGIFQTLDMYHAALEDTVDDGGDPWYALETSRAVFGRDKFGHGDVDLTVAQLEEISVRAVRETLTLD
jgi:hypothetical protein